MNLQLLQSFGHNYPEDFDGILDCVSIAITCSFNRFGSLLAVGCNDGRIVIFDFITRGVAKVINAHVHPVCSLSWSRNGRRLLSASTDNTVSIWSVLTGDCERTYRFSSPVLRVQFNPRKDHEFLVCPLKYQAILIDTNDDQRPIDIPADDDDLNIVASYERRGEYVFTGNGRGRIAVYAIQRVAPRDRLAVQLAAAFRVASSGSGQVAVKQIEFARRGDTFLVNGSDRVIRVYATRDVLARGAPANGADAEQFVAFQKLQDLVNKTIWKKCVFSGDGEFVCAGSARQHALYVWEVQSGTLTKILHGTKGEFLLDVIWHPLRPIIASVSNGVVSIWAEQQVENWSAFAPDFKELDENVEYEERESEFDEEDEDKRLFQEREQAATAASKKNSNGNGDDDSLIDVDQVEPIPQLLSSDEEDDDSSALVYLPVAPEIEEPEDQPVPAAAAPASFGSPPSNAAPEPSVTPNGKKRTQKGGSRVSAALSSGNSAGSHRQVNIDLPGGPASELHPLLQSVGSKRPAVSLPAGVSATVPPSAADAADSASNAPNVTVGSAPSGASHKVAKVAAGQQQGHAHGGGHHQHKHKTGKSKKSVW